MTDDLDPSIDAARRAHARGALGQWVEQFLRSPGSDNEVLADELGSVMSSWCGPLPLRFDDLHRLAGPPGQPTLERLDQDDLDTVEAMGTSLEQGWDPPPLIVSFRDGQLVVEDGNHRIEGLRRSGHTRYWSVVGFENDEQRDEFISDSRVAPRRRPSSHG